MLQNYIEQFLDEDKELAIRKGIMERYFNNIEFILDL